MLQEVALKVAKRKNNMNEKQHKELIKSIERIEKILQQRVIIELYRSGIPQSVIGKNLGIGAGVVNKLLKGAKRQNQYGKETKPQNSSKTSSKNKK